MLYHGDGHEEPEEAKEEDRRVSARHIGFCAASFHQPARQPQRGKRQGCRSMQAHPGSRQARLSPPASSHHELMSHTAAPSATHSCPPQTKASLGRPSGELPYLVRVHQVCPDAARRFARKQGAGLCTQNFRSALPRKGLGLGFLESLQEQPWLLVMPPYLEKHQHGLNPYRRDKTGALEGQQLSQKQEGAGKTRPQPSLPPPRSRCAPLQNSSHSLFV